MRPPITFFVTGTPKGQPRARATRRGNHAGVYDPGTADGWKACVRADWKALGQPAWVGPVKVSLRFYFPRPKGHFRTGKRAGELRPDAPNWHTGKPDRDNLDKAVLDALTNAGAWADDAQVCDGRVAKRFCPLGSPSGVSIEISECHDGWPTTKGGANE